MKYGFIGCGNMGGAIARALAKETTDFMISDRSGKGIALAEELGCTYGSVQTVAENCERIYLAVKPQMMADVLAPLQDIFRQKKPLLITMAAGLTISQIEQFADSPLPVIRIMPNTPVSVGKGMTVYCRNGLVENSVLEDFLQDMRHSGTLDALDESLIDAASALSGSGPAYMYIFMEALADGAVSCGIPRAKAMEYAAETMAGAAEIYLQTRIHPGQLKDAVCSPKGSTLAGIRSLEEHAFRAAIIDCVCKTYQRNTELGK